MEYGASQEGTMANRKTGTIKKFIQDKSFGFISPEDGSKDVWFHASSVDGNPAEGLKVEFTEAQGNRGPEAGNVKIIKESLPKECIFPTFYNYSQATDQKHLKQEIFFEAPKKAADFLKNSGLTSSALRMLFQGFRSFASRLDQGGLSFDRAKELFGDFYTQKVIRQNQRGMLPDPVVVLIDEHKELILSNPAEMKGFYKYLTNILCYFGDKVK